MIHLLVVGVSRFEVNHGVALIIRDFVRYTVFPLVLVTISIRVVDPRVNSIW